MWHWFGGFSNICNRKSINVITHGWQRQNEAQFWEEVWETENYTEQNPLCPNRKLRHFSHFSYPPVIPRGWRTALDATNITFTKFSITQPNRMFHVCDELQALIEARNGYDEQKAYGADFFFPCNFFYGKRNLFSGYLVWRWGGRPLKWNIQCVLYPSMWRDSTN